MSEYVITVEKTEYNPIGDHTTVRRVFQQTVYDDQCVAKIALAVNGAKNDNGRTSSKDL